MYFPQEHKKNITPPSLPLSFSPSLPLSFPFPEDLNPTLLIRSRPYNLLGLAPPPTHPVLI